MTLQEAAWNLLDAMQAATFARGLEEQQDTRWDVTRAETALRVVLNNIEETNQC